MTAGSIATTHSDSILGAGHGILSPILGPSLGVGGLATAVLSAVVGWVLGGARAALLETAHVIGVTTAPHLTSAWFSAEYWRVAGLAALVTVPFLCAAALQAVIRSDLSLLSQSVLLHLPVAVIGVNLAAPVVMLLLAATDQMCGAVAGPGGPSFLIVAARDANGLSAIGGSAFFAVVVGVLTAAAALALTLELLIREAAVDVVVLMLPLVFAGLVWPARRIWAVRLIELLVGLILSKFVIVAVLSLAGAALAGGGAGGPRLLTAMALVLLSTFAPWAMLRLLPFTELAAGAADALGGQVKRAIDATDMPSSAESALDVALSVPRRLRQDVEDAGGLGPGSERTPGPEPNTAPALPTDVSADPADRSGSSDEPSEAVPDYPPRHDQSPISATQRRPGMAPIWQAGNGEWPPMRLAPGGWRGPTAYDRAEARPQAPRDASEPAEEPSP
jgi:hypothetical protein